METIKSIDEVIEILSEVEISMLDYSENKPTDLLVIPDDSKITVIGGLPWEDCVRIDSFIKFSKVYKANTLEDMKKLWKFTTFNPDNLSFDEFKKKIGSSLEDLYPTIKHLVRFKNGNN
jgi:hypothetical protein